MQLTNAVAQVYLVPVAGTTAVGEVGPFGEESAEDAVLHVKHRHVLMQSDLEPRGRSRGEKIENLGDVEIVGDREVFEAFVNEQSRADGIGDVEGKVSDHGEMLMIPEMPDSSQIAHEDTVGFGIFDDAEETALPRLLNARSGEKNSHRRSGRAHAGDEIAVATHILEIDVDRRQTALDRGVDLRLGAAEDAEFSS